jgi:two-component system chemotaxis response regulator CheY
MIISRTLRQAGLGHHIVLEARDGAEGLVLAHTEAPDLVLSDWNMPEVDGIQLLRALRASGNQVAFGFVTAQATADRRMVAEQAGALFCVAKPVTADALAELLGPVLTQPVVGA